MTSSKGYYGSFSYSYLYDILRIQDMHIGVNYKYSNKHGWWFILKLNETGTLISRHADGTTIGATNKSARPLEWTFEEAKERARFLWTKIYNRHWSEDWNKAPSRSDVPDLTYPAPDPRNATRGTSRRPSRGTEAAPLAFGALPDGAEDIEFSETVDRAAKEYYCEVCNGRLIKNPGPGRPPKRCVNHGGKARLQND